MPNIARLAGIRYLNAMGLMAGVTMVPLLALGTAGCASTKGTASTSPSQQQTAAGTTTAPATQRGMAKEGPHERMEMYIGPSIPPEHLEREHR